MVYKKLSDAVKVTGNPDYKGEQAHVFYSKQDQSRDMLMGYNWLKKNNIIPNLSTLNQTHTLLGSLGTLDKERIFEMMQGETWSPQGEARSLIESAKLSHTSMSVGDIVKIENKLWMVDRIGWKAL